MAGSTRPIRAKAKAKASGNAFGMLISKPSTTKKKTTKK